MNVPCISKSASIRNWVTFCGSEDENLEDYVPYVRVKDRRKQKLVKLGRITEIKEDTKPTGAGGSG